MRISDWSSDVCSSDLGLVVSALFAKELARMVKVDYRLLVASAYSGVIVWHGGLAGSIPLTIATEGHFQADKIGLIPTSDTIFSFFNIARSEEHTSELQSLMLISYAVFCLKKKKTTKH